MEIAGTRYAPGCMLVLNNNNAPIIKALESAHLILLGGAAMDGPRYVWWNFVSSDRERIEQAKADWQEGRFTKVPGDEIEFIPLPDS